MSMLPGPLRAEHAKPRWDSDWYVEPASCVHDLFNTIKFFGQIHDPACGSGTIPKVATELDFIATGSDLVDRGYGIGGVDYLKDKTLYANIVTNPPYKLAEEFAQHALKNAYFKIAMVVRITFLAGQKRRASLFEPYPPSDIVILSKRPSMPPGGSGIPASGGTTDYCWVIWDQSLRGPTTLHWAKPSKRKGDPNGLVALTDVH